MAICKAFKKVVTKPRIPSPSVHETPKRDIIVGHVDYPMEYLDYALGTVTGKFEGRGYGNVSDNFDNMGVSCGVLQWNYGMGSLQSNILIPYLEKHGSIDKLGIFPSTIMDKSSYKAPKAAVEFAQRYMLTGTKLKREWRVAWTEFMLLPEVIELQKLAADSVADATWKYCKQYNMKTKRAFCWFFDIRTQNGSLKGISKPKADKDLAIKLIKSKGGKNKDEWLRILEGNSSLSPGNCRDEVITLFIWSVQRAAKCNWRWQSDVISRKGTIAFGNGIVHGDLFRQLFTNK